MERGGKNRDPRRGGRGARGGSRGTIRPRVQSQSGPESSSQTQPYHPQMYPQSPPFFYSSQPLPQIPTNFDPFESSHTQQTPPANPPPFNPYEPRYTQQKRREREPLPIGDDNEEDEYFDDVDVVPETQQIEEVEEDEEVEEQVVKKKKPSKPWTPEEEEALAKSWIKISVDKEIGDRQPKMGFWKRVLKHFRTLVPGTERTHHQLNSKWGPMHTMIAGFNGYYQQANRVRDSGCGDVQVLDRANRDFEKQYKKIFAHSAAWHILKDQPKWQEQPVVGVSQTQESTGSSKKRKSSESSSAQTPINVEDFECDLPNLNENPTPSRQSKGKKKTTSGDSSRSSMHDAIASYTAEKKNLMQAQLEVQKKKDDEYFNFLQGEVVNRDMKFVMDPHDNIPDPAFKEFVIAKKREICAKYGWPCSL